MTVGGAEQPLGPYSACLLGSFNLTKYLWKPANSNSGDSLFDMSSFIRDIPIVVRAMDNIIDKAIYPLPQQEVEAKNKRRMGLGITGLANTLEVMGLPYGSEEFLESQAHIMEVLRDECYKASIELAKEKGAFPLFDIKLLESEFAKTLPDGIRDGIAIHGLRNSHLLSVAPTGTISLSADNVSSGIEPVFSHSYDRTIQTVDGPRIEKVTDWALREHGVKGVTADELNVMDHVKVLNVASYYVDSACSKTCNVGDEVTWEEFKDVYLEAYLGGASGCTTFRAAGKRYGILNASASEDVAEEPDTPEDNFIDEGGACYYDTDTGLRQCE